jgi:Tol biopolymer transport system component
MGLRRPPYAFTEEGVSFYLDGVNITGREESPKERIMRLTLRAVVAVLAVVGCARCAVAQQARSEFRQNLLDGKSPLDELPAHITRITAFGERADWSHDGKKILFLSKTFGDAMEIDLATRTIRNLTAHYPHHGYTRALYLANGDILLSGPERFDPRRASDARVQCLLYVLDKSGMRPAASLGTKCSEGPAVSRKRMHIAWAQVAAQYPDEMRPGSSRIYEADVEYADGKPVLTNRRPVIESGDLAFRCTLEAQNFRPPDEHELTFSAYDHQNTDVCAINLKTKRVTNYSDAPDQYDEPEGIFRDGRFTLVECDRQNQQGSGHVDIWKLALDGSGQLERLTHFSDYPGYKASNPVVSDDGRFIAFQLAKSTDAAGVGHGILVYDVQKAAEAER